MLNLLIGTVARGFKELKSGNTFFVASNPFGTWKQFAHVY